MSQPTIPDQIATAIARFPNLTALRDRQLGLSYAQLGGFIAAVQPVLAGHRAVAVFGVPGALFGAAVTACVVNGRPFVHLDPAMPRAVLANILAELNISLVLTCQTPKPDQLPAGCCVVEAGGLLGSICATVTAARVQPADAIYLVATSGTTGRPKCIPVTHDAGLLSYHWREEYAPYSPGMKVGVYIFAIWELLRPLRFGAEICFPLVQELLSPQGLADFITDHDIHEMLFTPSFLEKILGPVDPVVGARLPLRRVILNGEVVRDRLIAEVQTKLPQVELWNLYSICETHDICMSRVTGLSDRRAGVTVGRAMPHLRAVVLDHDDRECPPGTPGLLHFEGPRMLGPGYVNRPEESARRFRELELNGRAARLYDTGDQGIVDASGQITVLGRVAHMLKLRGHSIQTAELTQTMAGLLQFGQAIPWVTDIDGGDQALVFYYTADAAQLARNDARWQMQGKRLPKALVHALRQVLPAYCIPSYLVHLAEVPINQVSGKCDYKALPAVVVQTDDDADLPVLAQVARIMHCDAVAIDPDQSFHELGGDSLMCVDLVLALEAAYARPVDFDWALNLPLMRLHHLLTEAADTAATGIERPGILLTGATGFLGRHVLTAALAHLPPGQVVYCLIRPGNRDPQRRLDGTVADADRARVVIVSGQIDASCFGLDAASYAKLSRCVHQVIHCAATVNLAVDQAHMVEWSQAGIRTVLQFCRDAGAELRFSSSTAVFPETGGLFAEGPAQAFEGCSGYGAAKIAAEAEIAASGVPAALVRLPSLYDMAAPNPRDICEIVLAACRQLGAMPQGLTFPMTDVRAAAAFLVGLPAQTGVAWFNLIADVPIVARGLPVLPAAEWVKRAPLSDGVRRLIASDPLTIAADARFDNAAARSAWRGDYAAICDAPALIARRLYHSEPALI